MVTDHELIVRVQAGDAAAFEALFARHHAALRRHVAGIVRDDGTADDVVQEVFVRLWTRADHWTGRGAVRAWLFRIATNLALNHLRSLRRRPQQSLDRPAPWSDADGEAPLPTGLVDAAARGPEGQVERAERARALRLLIAALPAGQRAVIRLVYEADLTIRSVAGRLGVPEGTVKSRLHSATRRLAAAWHDLDSTWEEDP